MHILIYIYIFQYMFIHIHMYIHINVYMNVCVCVCVCVCACMCECVCMHLRVYVFLDVYCCEPHGNIHALTKYTATHTSPATYRINLTRSVRVFFQQRFQHLLPSLLLYGPMQWQLAALRKRRQEVMSARHTSRQGSRLRCCSHPCW